MKGAEVGTGSYGRKLLHSHVCVDSKDSLGVPKTCQQHTTS